MPIAEELNIQDGTQVSAMNMAEVMFGQGVQIVSATYTGDPVAAGIYTNATQTLGTVTQSDTGVILSTGNVSSFTQGAGGGTDPNVAESTGSNNAGADGNAALDAMSGFATFDAAIFEASFIPTGDLLTMQFVFSSDEYIEYANSGFNDAYGVWVNDVYVPFVHDPSGGVSINSVNNTDNRNLYTDNPAAGDAYNTEMDGFTVTLSFHAPVNVGQVNTIRIAIADGGDSAYDSNLLIAGDSIQTLALAQDDYVQLTPNASRVVDVLANDRDLTETGLGVTHINGVPVVVGQSVTLPTGETVTLNADGTLTVQSDGDLGSNVLTYTIADGAGNTDVGYIVVTTVATPGPDGIVHGTEGSDLIDTSYTGDPDGDRIDAGDGRGVYGTTGDADYVLAGAGDDTILSGAADDILYAEEGSDRIDAGTGNDQIFAGLGDDSVIGGEGDDVAYLAAGNDTFGGGGAEEAGNDTVYGAGGNDSIATGSGDDVAFGDAGNDQLGGGAGNDSLTGGAANDTLTGDAGNDTLAGGDDRDVFYGGAGDVADGGEGGDDFDVLYLTNVASVAYGGGANEAGTVTFADATTMTFTNIERLVLNGGNPDGIVYGTSGADLIGAGYVDGNGDVIDNNDALLPAAVGDDDEIYGLEGNDTIAAGEGRDNAYGGADDDLINAGAGNDYVQGDTGNDTVAGDVGDDFLRGDSGNDSVYGGVGNDSVYGGADSDSVYGGDGADEVYGGFGTDTVYGGAGNDSVTGSGGNDVVHGDDGDDRVQGSIGSDTIYGGAGADTLLGEEDADTFYGGATDEVDGGESVTTGTDDDTLYVTDVERVIFDPLNSENGIVFFNGGGQLSFYNIENLYVDGILQVLPPDYIVEGSGGADVIDAAYTGDPEGDRIDAGDNQTSTDGDRVEAYGGADTITSGAGDDTVFGGTGDDSVVSGAGNDVLLGEDGRDDIAGGVGDDTLYGGAGNDTIDAGTGTNAVDGGADRDTIVVSAQGGGVVDGGEDGDDFDTLDLRGQGRLEITYSDTNPEDGSVEFFDDQGQSTGILTFTNIENVIPCFTPGAMILTDTGEMAVEHLRAGDRVLTRDNGFQMIAWVGRRDLSFAEVACTPAFAPVCIARGALGAGLPLADLVVSPQHRMLLTGARAEMLFGEREVLAAALHLVGRPGITRAAPGRISYLHVMFDQHEIIRANGAWTESFQPGDAMLNSMDSRQRDEILALFPELRGGTVFAAARISLKAHETGVLLHH